METALIKTKSHITLFHNSEIHNISKTDRRYQPILNAFGKGDTSKISDLLNSTGKTLEQVLKSDKDFTYSKDKITYKGKILEGVFITKLKSMIRDGSTDLNPLKLFLENLYKNPSEKSIKELYNFLEVKELPITTDGHFLAYKGVSNNYYTIRGNTETKVIKGTVDSTGHIYNGAGEEIEIDRNSVDADTNRDCSYGVHAGSFSYADNWKGHSGRLMIVKIHPKDVVSVPCSDANKMRVCRYRVVSEYAKEIETPVLDEAEEKDPAIAKYKNKISGYLKIAESIKNYLANKKKQKIKSVTLREIKNALKKYKDATMLDVLEIIQTNFTNRVNVHKEFLSKTIVKI